MIEERQPSFLLEGSLLITGEVDRTTPFERGMPGQQAFRGGEWVSDPLILDVTGRKGTHLPPLARSVATPSHRIV